MKKLPRVHRTGQNGREKKIGPSFSLLTLCTFQEHQLFCKHGRSQFKMNVGTGLVTSSTDDVHGDDAMAVDLETDLEPEEGFSGTFLIARGAVPKTGTY